MVRLRIVADDFGVSRARTHGIVRAMQSGAVTHTSVMANGLYAAEAMELARARGLLDRVGLHLVLSEGRCLAPADAVPSLLTQSAPDGTARDEDARRMLGKEEFGAACASGAVVPAEAAAEAAAQIRWFEAAAGRAPEWVDGHQHCHVAPTLCRAFAEVFSNARVRRVRIPYEPLGAGAAPVCATCAAVHATAAAARAVYASAGLEPTADRFVGRSLCGRAYTAQELADAVRAQLSDGAASVEVRPQPRARCAAPHAANFTPPIARRRWSTRANAAPAAPRTRGTHSTRLRSGSASWTSSRATRCARCSRRSPLAVTRQPPQARQTARRRAARAARRNARPHSRLAPHASPPSSRAST